MCECLCDNCGLMFEIEYPEQICFDCRCIIETELYSDYDYYPDEYYNQFLFDE